MREFAGRFIGVVTGERRRTRRGGRRSTDHEPNRGWIPILALALPIALLDWATKWTIVQTIPLHEMRVISDRVAFWHVKNPALVLGLHGEMPLGFRKLMVTIYATIAFLLLIAVLMRGHRLLPHRRKWAWIFLGMVAGGMLGNLGERVLHWGVTDYLSFRWGDIYLPPGNVADLSILLSMPVAMAVLLFELEARALRRNIAVREAAAAAPEMGRATPDIGGLEA